jgi:TRAP-type mannitol/chloroaromatic compound transport system permease small subunit
MTVIDILTTIFFLPAYLYLTMCNYRLVKEEEKRMENEAKNGANDENRVEERPQGYSSE